MRVRNIVSSIANNKRMIPSFPSGIFLGLRHRVLATKLLRCLFALFILSLVFGSYINTHTHTKYVYIFHLVSSLLLV